MCNRMSGSRGFVDIISVESTQLLLSHETVYSVQLARDVFTKLSLLTMALELEYLNGKLADLNGI